MSEKTCPNCGAALMPGDIFCGECGMRVEEADYDVAPATPANGVSPEVMEESLLEEPDLAAEPTAGAYLPPPPVRQETSGWTVLRIAAIVVAVGFLLLSLCLCSLGGVSLIGESSPTAEENLGFVAAFCFAPGVILGLLGVGVAYFGFRKR